MERIKNYVGIDISKPFFDVAFADSGKYKHVQLSNDIKGFVQLSQLLDGRSCHIVMEASGPYYLKLAGYLYESGIAVSVVNPLVIRRFCQMRLSRAKTDKKDATMIAEYGKAEQPSVWHPEAAHVLELKQLQAAVDQLNKSRTNLIRQKEAFDQNPILSKDVAKAIKKTMQCLEKQIEGLELKMQQLAEIHYANLYDKLRSVPGLGKKTALLLIVLTGGFKKFSNAKQVSSYFGLCPRIFESGISIKGKSRITKMGMSRIRAMLYICSWSAKRYNEGCRELYDRLVGKGKSKRLALIAVANKLIKQAFSIATNDTVYDKNYQKNICF